MKKNEILKMGLILGFLLSTIWADENRVNIGLKVVDQDNTSLSEVLIDIGSPASTNREGAITVSKENGAATVEIEKSLLLIAGASKEGYYQTRLDIPMSHSMGKVEGEIKPLLLKLKKIKNPIPLYAKNLKREGAGPLTPPVESQNVGYDLMVGDWVTPQGKGKISDLIFFYESKYVSDSEFSRTTQVRFSNEKDGLIPFEAPLHKGSVLVSDYQAPETGYLAEWNQVISRTAENPNNNTRNEQRNFYFRVRTELDEQGEIKNAHYGKIYGDFMSFIYYFNPTSNDRNVEFDPQRNLFKNLHWKEKVERP